MLNQEYDGYTNHATFEVVVEFLNTYEKYIAFMEWIDLHGAFTDVTARKFVEGFWPDKTPYSGYNLNEVDWKEVAYSLNQSDDRSRDDVTAAEHIFKGIRTMLGERHVR